MDREIREQEGDFFIKHLIQKEKYDARYITYNVGPKLHCIKKVSNFPVPSRDVTNQTIPGGE
jgi:hypothetical protein